MYPILFEFFGKGVSSWTLFALCGAWICYWSISSDLKTRKIPNFQIQIFMLGAIIAWYVGARLGQVLTVGSTPAHYTTEVPAGGLVLYGGSIGAAFYILLPWGVFKWKNRIDLRNLADFGIIGLAWAQCLGRVGCTLYGCCYGTPSGHWPGYTLNYQHWDHQNLPFPHHLLGVKLHPAPLYESLGILFILAILSFMRYQQARTQKQGLSPDKFPSGLISLVCIIAYGLLRFFLEFIRDDNRGSFYAGLSPSQWLALGTSLLGFGLILLIRYETHSTASSNESPQSVTK